MADDDTQRWPIKPSAQVAEDKSQGVTARVHADGVRHLTVRLDEDSEITERAAEDALRAVVYASAAFRKLERGNMACQTGSAGSHPAYGALTEGLRKVCSAQGDMSRESA
jgi:hypothetical protein